MAKVITSLRDSPSAKRVLLDIITLLSSLLSLEEGCPIMVVSHTVHTKLQRQWQRKFFHHLSLLFSYHYQETSSLPYGKNAMIFFLILSLPTFVLFPLRITHATRLKWLMMFFLPFCCLCMWQILSSKSELSFERQSLFMFLDESMVMWGRYSQGGHLRSIIGSCFSSFRFQPHLSGGIISESKAQFTL